MKNKKYYPFERNHYFYGKLLTVRDFEEEQKYINDKRRIDNFLTAGAGVVSGLNVLLVNDKTILVEAGMALDYQGREIIVEDSITKKLNVIDGFEDIRDFDSVYLCLEYDEETIEAVHSISGSDSKEKSNYNRVAEKYHLFLTDKMDFNDYITVERLISQRQMVYDENGLKITHIAPLHVQNGQPFTFTVQVEKIDLPRSIELNYAVKSDFIKTAEGQNQLDIHISDQDGTSYKKTDYNFTLIAEAADVTQAEYIVEEQDDAITIGTNGYSLPKQNRQSSLVVQGSVQKAMIEKYFSIHFDNLMNHSAENHICLAKFRIIKRKQEYSIIDLESLPFSQFILSNQMLYMLMKYGAEQPAMLTREVPASITATTQPSIMQRTDEKLMASGVEIITVDLRSKNKVYYSDELVHGLGAGDVFLSIGLHESIYVENSFNENKLYFGNSSIFEGSAYQSRLPKLETAVVAYPDRGTFRIGVKLLSDSTSTSVTVNWYAVKSSVSRDYDPSEVNRVAVQIKPDTVSLTPREKFKFTADITGTDSKECRWKIIGEGGGKIDANGVYEAPMQPGVYEISAESVKYPNKSATAFVVVIEGDHKD